MLSSYLALGLPVQNFKALLSSLILTTCSAHLKPLDLITLNILHEIVKNCKVPKCEASYFPHSHISWVRIFALGSVLKNV